VKYGTAEWRQSIVIHGLEKGTLKPIIDRVFTFDKMSMRTALSRSERPPGSSGKIVSHE